MLELYEWMVETHIKFSLKIEKGSLLKQLFMKIKISTCNILQFLNKGVVRGLKGPKFIILSAFFGE